MAGRPTLQTRDGVSLQDPPSISSSQVEHWSGGTTILRSPMDCTVSRLVQDFENWIKLKKFSQTSGPYYLVYQEHIDPKQPYKPELAYLIAELSCFLHSSTIPHRVFFACSRIIQHPVSTHFHGFA